MKAHFILGIGLSLALAACGDKEVEYDASGIFETTEIIVSAQTAGELTALTAEEGRTVEAGEKLGCVDTVQLALKKRQLSASLTATDSKRLDRKRQVAALRQQIDNLQREKARFSELLKADAATEKQVDELDYQIAILQRQLEATEEQINSSNSSLDGQSSGIEAQLAQVEDQIRKSVAASPIKGIILAKYAEPGEYVVPGKPLFKMADISRMKLRAYLTADQLTTLKIGQKVTVYADQGKTDRKAYEGTVVWIADEAEFTPKTIQTREERANLVYAVKIAVSNDGLIKRGMYGDVKF
jgi:HlyD family secretion protein